MLRRFFDIEEGEKVSDFQFIFQNEHWALAALLFAGLLGFAVYLYRSESWLAPNRRLIMGGCYLLAGFLIVLLLLEPALRLKSSRSQKSNLLVLLDVSASMSIPDHAGGPEPDETAAEGNLSGAQAQPATRLSHAKDALLDIGNDLGDKYSLHFYTMGDRLQTLSLEGNDTQYLGEISAEAGSSRIGSAMEEAISRHAGQHLAGVVLLSDFSWIEGSDPVEVAREFKRREVPVYTVAFGMPSPPDIRVRRLIAPEVAFAGDKVPIRVQVDSSGFEDRSVEVVLQMNEEELERRELTLSGSSQFIEFSFVPPKGIERANLTASIEEMPGEVALENNLVGHGMQVIDEKINVLYVEGMPRWEYRYLRWVLLRDPRLNVRFLMTQGDKYLAATSPRHLGVFPTEAEEMLSYDLVILGDVIASYFTSEQVRWMEELVKGRELSQEDNGTSLVGGGGSLLMLGGQVGSPSSYFNTPIADILPVKMDSASRRWFHGGSHPVVTADGMEGSVVSLHPDKDVNDRIWKMVTPMGFMSGLTPKPGATVLLSRSGSDPTALPYPLVAWQRYGKGKSMYVGTDDLWRLRREVGDQFHARFWGQAIQFLALSRKLGQNKQVTLETARRQYSTGERVELFANVLTETFDPVDRDSYPVLLDRNGSGDYPIEVSLDPVPGTPGLYGKSILVTEPGDYELRAMDSDALKANVADFEVDRLSLEQRETSMRDELADQLASLSGGNRLLDFSEEDSDDSRLADLAGLLPGRLPKSLPVEREKALWDIPAIFALLVLLTGLEWYLRRRENLV
ncbi:MAG: glutamine amidotransferase [Verrucomicrobiota bacterium]|nr:glutamine amidotransferase [Verrucomicrobiota bacterium]|tara:strand:+ start:2755 stop:5136 length:2382 start_codon:yes stop_codon:yes gene_type:complete